MQAASTTPINRHPVRNSVRTAAGLVIAAAFLSLAFGQVDWAGVAQRAASAAFVMVVHLMLWLPVTFAGAAFLNVPGASQLMRRPARERSAA
jgi:hypothetical protein